MLTPEMFEEATRLLKQIDDLTIDVSNVLYYEVSDPKDSVRYLQALDQRVFSAHVAGLFGSVRTIRAVIRQAMEDTREAASFLTSNAEWAAIAEANAAAARKGSLLGDSNEQAS